jgi:hypothetical protein
MAYDERKGLVWMIGTGASEYLRDPIRESPRLLHDRIIRKQTPMPVAELSKQVGLADLFLQLGAKLDFIAAIAWADGWLSTTAK